MKAYRHRVQYYETDKMGIVHHSNYIRWMEEARIAFFDAIGWSFKHIEEMGIISPVSAVECRYKAPTRFDDFVDIKVKILEFRGVKLKLGYIMTREGEVVCEGITEHGFLNQEGKIISLKRNYPDLYADMVAQMEKDQTEEI